MRPVALIEATSSSRSSAGDSLRAGLELARIALMGIEPEPWRYESSRMRVQERLQLAHPSWGCTHARKPTANPGANRGGWKR